MNMRFNKELVYATKGSSGFDIESAETFVLHKGERRLVSTGLVMLEGNPWYELQIRPRSGLAVKHGITVLNSPGTVDSDYIGMEIKVLLINLGEYDYCIAAGDRIAQGVLTTVSKLVDSKCRADDRIGGFGSTGC